MALAAHSRPGAGQAWLAPATASADAASNGRRLERKANSHGQDGPPTAELYAAPAAAAAGSERGGAQARAALLLCPQLAATREVALVRALATVRLLRGRVEGLQLAKLVRCAAVSLPPPLSALGEGRPMASAFRSTGRRSS